MKTFLLLLPCLAALVAGQMNFRGHQFDRPAHKEKLSHGQHGQHQRVTREQHQRQHPYYQEVTHKQHQRVSHGQHGQHQKVTHEKRQRVSHGQHGQHQKVTHERHQRVSHGQHGQHQKVTHEHRQKVSHGQHHHGGRSTVAPLACDKDSKGRRCYQRNIPAEIQNKYKNEFNAIDINHNGCINLKEFEVKGVEVSDTLAAELKSRFQRLRQTGGWKQFGGGKRRLQGGTDVWKYLESQGFTNPKSSQKTKKQKNAEKDARDSKRAAHVFKKFDADHSDQITECEYAEAMYKLKRREDRMKDVVVVHG